MNTAKAIIPLSILFLPVVASAQKQSNPNIIFILADDLGWNDIGCMGSLYYETPNIDRIAKKGVCFTDAYASCQVSSPSRASILTGKYPPRHGITNWIGELSGEEWRKMHRSTKMLPAQYAHALSADETTLPKYLQGFGYTTFIAGKWHLGEEESSPEDHGFDINKGGWAAGGPKGGYFSPYENPKLNDGPLGENLSMRLSRETVSFMENHYRKSENKPFFVYLSFYAVHGPIQTTKERWAYFRNKAEQMGIKNKGFEVDRTLPVRQTQDNPVYAGLIQQMDDAVGLLLDALERSGLDKNTMIIFTSDNGGVSSGDAFSTALLPLRGGKGRQWEGGLRVPLLIQTPRTLTQPSVCHTPVIGTDFYPTILDFAKIPLLPSQHIDGENIMPLLKGLKIKQRALYWHYPHYGNQGGEPSSIVRMDNWKLIRYHEDNHLELYDLSTDISESEPLNAQFPNILSSLNSKLNLWLNNVDARMPIADKLYEPQKEKQIKTKWKTTILSQQEDLRKAMLSIEWSPNNDWWGSIIMNE